MIRKINNFRNTLFFRLILIFLIAMIPIYYVGISIYNWSIEKIKDDIVDTKVSQLDFYIKNLENDIQRLVILQSDCLNSDDLNWMVNRYSMMSDYDRGYSIMQIKNKLISVKSSSIYADDVIVYMPTIKKRISAVTGVDDMSGSNPLFINLMSSKSRIILYNSQLYTSLVYKVGNKPYYSIIIRLSGNSLKEALEQFNNEKNSSTILTDTSGNPVISGQTSVEKEVCSEIVSRQVTGISAGGSKCIIVQQTKYLATYVSSPYLGLMICNIIPENVVFNATNKYKIWFWLFLTAAVVIIIAFSLSFYLNIQKPLKALLQAFKRVDSGDLNFTINCGSSDEFTRLFEYFNVMLQSLSTLINQSYKQKIMLQDAELKQLQAQINPHFLYNSYFILHRMIKGRDYERAVLFSKHMGTYFQFVTRSAHNEVSLEKEIEHASIYMELQAMRFEGRIAVECENFPEEYAQLQVPRLILQPIIENVFEHGLKDKIENGLMRLSFEGIANGLIIRVEDNGDTLEVSEITHLNDLLDDSSESVEITAITNIHRRLQLMYGKTSGLVFSRSELGGLCVSIVIRTQEEKRMPTHTK